MKFAKHMASKAVPTWSTYYLDYKRLKKTLEPLLNYVESVEQGNLDNGVNLANDIDLNEVEERFQETFKEEVDKVEFFTYSKLKQCRTVFQQLTLQFFELKYPQAQTFIKNDDSRNTIDTRGGSRTNSLQPSQLSIDASEKLSASLHSLMMILKHLSSNFIPLNKLAVYKIFKKHDKVVSRVKAINPNAIKDVKLDLAKELLNTAKTERRFYFRYKDDANALFEEVQHMQHEINRLSIRKRQEGIV